ncbi:hypothetical protein BASA81_001060 [Batrachochytrium salamandrivorans]|nr:hypothetical protein BASA81_001060 [Batrachochytrium salamandrivorans]
MPGYQQQPSGESLRRLRRLDMYRKVPKDLTEGSVIGGLVTAVAVIVLLLLTLAELRSLSQVTLQTEILVDKHSANTQIRINLDVTVLGLSCEYLSVDLTNALGLSREDLETSTLHKFSTDASGTWKGSAVKKPAKALHDYNIPEHSKDHYGNERHAIELNSQEEFDTALEEHEVLLVDFHSPRCIHCVRFAPTYELAAIRLNGTVQPRSRKYGVRLATLDCLQHIALCRANLIQAFPTVRVFRSTKSVSSSSTTTEATYEVYRGAREVEALVSFAIRTLEEVMQAKGDGEDGEDEVGTISKDSTTHAAGCRVEGYLDVARVPGSLIIRPHDADESHVFDLNLVNCDHRIDHLSFGTAGKQDKFPTKTFRGNEHGFVHAHFVSVVSRSLVLASGKKSGNNQYEFAMTSDSFKPATVTEVAHIEIMFDLNPMQIQVTELL